jgi:peptidoglycan hydrolase CwlO-like protein
MNKTFKNLKNQIDNADSSVSDLLKIYSKTSSDLKKANQIIEDLSKKLLVSENVIHNTKKQVESLVDLVKKN